jgi:hypothetical protein
VAVVQAIVKLLELGEMVVQAEFPEPERQLPPDNPLVVVVPAEIRATRVQGVDLELSWSNTRFHLRPIRPMYQLVSATRELIR